MIKFKRNLWINFKLKVIILFNYIKTLIFVTKVNSLQKNLTQLKKELNKLFN